MPEAAFDEIVLPGQEQDQFDEIVLPSDFTEFDEVILPAEHLTQATEQVVGLSDHSDQWNQNQTEMARRARDAGLPPAPGSRERLTDAIARTEAAGFKTPHFIGLDDEPTGDRGVTRDIENLVASLKQREAAAPETERPAIARERAYWEQEAANGMTAEQWKTQTGEDDPKYPHEKPLFDDPPLTGVDKAVIGGLVKARNVGIEALTEISPALSGRLFGQTTESLREEEKSKPLISQESARQFVGQLPWWAGGNTKLAQGGAEALSSAVSGFSNPVTIATLPAFAVPGFAEVFALNVLADQPKEFAHLRDTIKEHGFASKETGEAATTMGINDLMGFLAGKSGTAARYRSLASQIKEAPVRPASASEPGPVTETRPVPETAAGPEPVATTEAASEGIRKTGTTDQMTPGVERSDAATEPLSPPRTEETLGRSDPTIPETSSVPEQTSPMEVAQPEITTPAPPVQPEGWKMPDPVPVGTEASIAELNRQLGPKEAPPASEILPSRTIPEVPENLRPNPEVERLLNEPEAQTGPQMKFDPATEGGAFGFGGGKRATVAPKGTTPRGDTEFLEIQPGYKRVVKGLERKGAADVIGETRNKVGKLLADATKKHVDLEQELFGQLSTELVDATRGVPKKAVEAGFDEVSQYLAAKENGRPLPALSPVAAKLNTAWENIADTTGKISAANNVQVFDPVLGKHRPMHVMGKAYVPRMLKPEVEQVMRDPARNPRLWNTLVDELARQRGISDIAAAAELRAESGRFSSNDFMGNLEMARTGKLPEVFYDYDLRNLAARYIPSFSERMAQIIAYGQRLGPREAPLRPNLWDVARKESANTYTQEWLNSAENQAVNLKAKGTAAVGMARAQTAASGLLLSSPTTTVMRNLLSGISATPEIFGVSRSVGALVRTIKSSQAKMDAKAMGVVRDNIGDFLHADRLGDSPIDNALRSAVDAGLKYSGYNGSEVFVRSHGALTASQFAKDGVAAIAKNPKSMAAKEALGLFKRTGVDAQKIVAEGADWKTGPETRKFIRTALRDTQGGYRFDQVPLWANSNMGRFFYQFGRWGTQRARNIWQNGVKPALGEEVQWQGKTMTRRDIRPLVKMLAGTVLLGETFAGIAQILFGRDRRDASLSEISAAWDEDKKKAVGLAMQRMLNDVIMAGTLGIWSQPIDWSKSLKDQSRLKNPTEPPGLGSIRAFMELGQDFLDQGTVTRRDLLKFASSFTPGAKQVSDVARNVMDEPLYEAENDVKTLRGAAHRWGTQSGLDVSPGARGDFRKSEMAPTYEPIKEALLVGDATTAKFLAKTFLDKARNRKSALKSLKASIRNSQPFRAGPYTAKEHLKDFRIWAQKNLSAADYQQTERIQARYVKAAGAADLWGKSDPDD